MTRRYVWMAILVVAAGLLTGCASTSPGSAQPTPIATTTDSTPSSSSTGSDDQAPKVTKPLDASRFIQNTCSALSSADLAALGVNGAKATPGDDGVIGKGCEWSGQDAGNAVGISWETGDVHGLSDLYSIKSEQKYWTVMTVSGYPAVESAPNDERANGICDVEVGVSDTLYFISDFEARNDPSRACELAKQAAAAVIKNLGGR
jgi:hypothetical protein